MNNIIVGNNSYQLIDNGKDGYDVIFLEKWTEYFEPFDYILGDWSYGKLRLKGFYKSNHNDAKTYNDIKFYKEYLKNECAYGCRYFLLEKQSNE